MRGFKRGIAALGAVALVAVGLVTGAGPASAAHVTCGQTIVVNTVLDSNVGPCAAGITIGADNITFDLNGFTITGAAGTGQGAGVHGVDRSGVTVKKGIVTEFDAGVVFEGGGGNRVDRMQLLNNRGSFATDFGDGIGFYFSNGNFATRNLVQNNGPYDGIGLLVGDNNVIDQNKIINNNQSATNTAGIRLENFSGGQSSDNNIVTRNLVQNSGTFGIQLFAGAFGNQIRTNQVTTSRLDGFRIFAGGHDNVLEGNTSKNNGAVAGNGISVQAAAGNFPAAHDNQLLRNTATGNKTFNLLDANANCGTNQWRGNQGPPASPACTLNP